MKGLVTKSMGLWYEVEVNGKKRKARLRGKFRLTDKKITNPIAVGDTVRLSENIQEDNQYVIEEIFERTNYLIRKSPRKTGHDHLIASNIDQGVLIVTLKMPRTSIGFVDRFLINLETFRIPGIIIFNKQDLYNQKDWTKYYELKEIYETLGYQVFVVSFLKTIVPLQSIFSDRQTLLVGHSGAGKSTLINVIFGAPLQKVNKVSSFANKGVHTTTFAEMFRIDSHATLIDTPGIKELGLSDIQPEELSHFFPEMRPYLGKCKFHNCLHNNEPGCALKPVIGEKIHPIRYTSYLSILNGNENRK